MFDGLNLKYFDHQIITNLPQNPATAREFLKYVRILGLFFNISEGGIFAAERESSVFASKCPFSS